MKVEKNLPWTRLIRSARKREMRLTDVTFMISHDSVLYCGSSEDCSVVQFL